MCDECRARSYAIDRVIAPIVIDIMDDVKVRACLPGYDELTTKSLLIARMGSVMAATAAEVLNLTLEQRKYLMAEVEHTLMMHGGFYMDCPPCMEKVGKRNVHSWDDRKT